MNRKEGIIRSASKRERMQFAKLRIRKSPRRRSRGRRALARGWVHSRDERDDASGEDQEEEQRTNSRSPVICRARDASIVRALYHRHCTGASEPRKTELILALGPSKRATSQQCPGGGREGEGRGDRVLAVGIATPREIGSVENQRRPHPCILKSRSDGRTDGRSSTSSHGRVSHTPFESLT